MSSPNVSLKYPTLIGGASTANRRKYVEFTDQGIGSGKTDRRATLRHLSNQRPPCDHRLDDPSSSAQTVPRIAEIDSASPKHWT